MNCLFASLLPIFTLSSFSQAIFLLSCFTLTASLSLLFCLCAPSLFCLSVRPSRWLTEIHLFPLLSWYYKFQSCIERSTASVPTVPVTSSQTAALLKWFSVITDTKSTLTIRGLSSTTHQKCDSDVSSDVLRTDGADDLVLNLCMTQIQKKGHKIHSVHMKSSEHNSTYFHIFYLVTA